MTASDLDAAGDVNLAERFTGSMNATTSRFGVLCDIPIAFASAGAMAVGVTVLARYWTGLAWWCGVGLAAVPIVVCVAAHFALRNARHGVRAWLASLPFRVDNVNAVLCGSGEYFDIHFASGSNADLPSREQVMAVFSCVSEDAFVLDTDHELRIVRARFGVVDSKHNPLRSAHRRYVQMQGIVGGALVSLHARHPISHVQIVS